MRIDMIPAGQLTLLVFLLLFGLGKLIHADENRENYALGPPKLVATKLDKL